MIATARSTIAAHPFWALLIALIVFVPAGGLAWWLGSPLFIDQRVNEEFPRLVNATVPGNINPADAEVVMMTMEKISNPVAEPMMEPVTTPAPSVAAPDVAEVPADPVALLEGGFFGADAFHQGDGSATVYDLGDGSRVLRFEEFEVTNGPDLRVLVTPDPNPFDHAALVEAGYTELGRLKGNIGNQNYDIPPDVDTDSIGSVIIYCAPFHVIFAVAPLNAV
ncbi:MAG: DM13 domain-containing protein [Chloroflexi bacterium]|nr:DM13 domain-containing protein [Chloroflexota bacterium]